MTLARIVRAELQKGTDWPHRCRPAYQEQKEGRNGVCELRETVTFGRTLCLLYLPNSNRTTRGTTPGPMAHASAFTARRTARGVALVAQILAGAAVVAGNMRT